MVSIRLSSKNFKYDLEFHGKFSFLLGNSGSRKTHFVDLCFKLRKGFKSVSGNIKVDGIALAKEDINIFSNEGITVDYEKILMTANNKVFIIDEYSDIFHCSNLASLLLNSNNYFIFVTRNLLKFLPVNVQSVYIFKRNGKNIINVPKYNKFNYTDYINIEFILTEDSVGGRLFFHKNFKNIETCSKTGFLEGKEQLRNNSQLHKFLAEELKTRNNILVVYDSAAYAPFYELLLQALEEAGKLNKNVKVLDWESFENYILELPMFGEKYDIDSPGCQFNSLEQMCEQRLKYLVNYRKDSLLPCLNRNLDCTGCRAATGCKFIDRRDKDKIITGSLKTLGNV